MNEATKNPGWRWLGLFAIALCITTLLVGGFAFWQRAARQMSLAEALWVTERDYSHYYSPGTPESQTVVQALTAQNPALAEQRFDAFVLWRRGILMTDGPANDPLLIVGFDPSAIPPERKTIAR